MTKAELINTFSEKVGIGQSDSKIFFDILLKKLSAILKTSQSIFIPDFGYFHLIKGKLKRIATDESESIYEELIDIILYSSEEKLSQSEAEGFVFNVPGQEDETFTTLDSYFSLSIGKPLIPLRGYFDRNTYIPTSGYEYKKFLETKVDELISNSKIIASEEQFPILIIDARSYNSNELHLENAVDDLEALLSDEQTGEKSINKKPEENVVKNIAWDFGEILSQKISAESIRDLTDERINQPASEPSENQRVKKIPVASSEEENVLNQLLDNEKQVTDISSDMEGNLSEPKSEEEMSKIKTDSEQDSLNNLTEFEEVQPEVSSENQLQKNEDDLIDDEFWKNTSKLFETFNPREIRSDDGNEFTEIKSSDVHLGEFTNGKKKTEDTEKDEKVNDQIEKPNQRPAKAIVLDNEDYKPRRSKKWVFVISVLLILIALVIYYWYTELNKKTEIISKNNELSISSKNATIIGRDYRIPVSYPYIPENSLTDSVGKLTSQSGSSVQVDEQKVDEKKIVKQDVAITKKDAGNKNQIPEGRSVSLGKNIYKYGNVYVVQVASFRSSQIAENEAGKYRNKGYNAFVEPVEIKDKGLWYRIKVGNFATFSEAEDFISKNNR